eukprot:SAG11_NODE_254_length_11587_cov_4.312913_7_plen_92_part_00
MEHCTHKQSLTVTVLRILLPAFNLSSNIFLPPLAFTIFLIFSALVPPLLVGEVFAFLIPNLTKIKFKSGTEIGVYLARLDTVACSESVAIP